MDNKEVVTYDDSPEVVQPDSSPQVATAYQDEHSGRLETTSGKYLVDSEHRDRSDQYPQAVSLADDPSKHELSAVKYDDPPNAEEQDTKKATGGKILGLKRKTFIIAVIVALVIIAAAIGGGVGGYKATASSSSDASGSSSDSDSTQSSSDGSSTPTNTTPQGSTSSASQTTSSASASPTFLNNATDAGNRFAFQGFSKANYDGNYTNILRDIGPTDIGFDVRSFVWKPSESNCCVTFCLNETLRVGWTCDERYTNRTTETFLGIYVWCGEARDQKGSNAICSTGKGPTDHT